MHYPRCHSDEIYRHGLSPTKRECFRCQCCHRVFQLTYHYEARKPGVKVVRVHQHAPGSPKKTVISRLGVLAED
ncbi:hypothetical protein CE195_02990 [Sodalis-like symbiont of Philaenus spumarius]|nr:hypothetical protein CE195_02990 [Sodalis-like symbiont of Philaenus spumarius]